MKVHSQYFRNNLRGIRELTAVISYKDKNDGLYILTQNAENILTEDNYKLITQYKRVTYGNNSINRVNVTFNAELFNTICKSVQIETINKIELGTIINVRVGVYIEETEDYEFVDLGDYTVLTEPTYQVDTNSYSVIAYDKMYESMINYDDDPLEITYPITHKDMLIAICNKLGWYHQLNNYPNYDKLINEDIYQDRQLTYRDILNDLNKGCFGCLMFQNNRLILRVPSETGLIIEDNDLKDININLSEKYGKVNSLYVTDKGTVLNFKQDQESIELNGETRLNIANNLLMDSHNSTFINDLFNQIDGLEYTVFDVDSTGLLVLDPLDIVTFRHDGVDYKTIIFNDDISIQDGLTENLFSNKLEEDVSNYYARDNVTKKLTDAYIEIDKANGQIVLKVDNDGKIVLAQLKADPETGSEFNVSADNINFEGKTFNLTTENIAIDSTNFSVDKNGNMRAVNGEFTGGIKAGSSLDLVAQDGTYTTFKVTRQSDNTTYCGINGQSLVFFKNGIRRIYLSELLDASFLTVLSDDGETGATFSSVGSSNTSDIRYKENIKNIDKESSLKFITGLNPIEFTYKNNKQYHRGLSAQEVEQTLNKIGVKNEIYSINKEDGKYMLYYNELIPDLINCVKIQQDQINELKKEIKSVKGE